MATSSLKLTAAIFTAVLLTPHLAMASDSCQFVRDAIDKLPATGGVVRISAGTYNCEAPIVIEKNNVIVKGDGTGKTVFRLADNVHAPLLVIGSSKTLLDNQGRYVTPFRVHNVAVEGISFDGNKSHHDPKKECGETICEADASSIRNNAISIRGASDIRLKNIEAHDSISGGLVSEKYCDHLMIENFDSHHNYFDGLAGYQTEKSVYNNVNLHDNRAAGISVDIRFNDNKFIGGSIENNSDIGIYARDAKNNLFDGLKINNNKGYGALLGTPDGPAGRCADSNTFHNVEISHSGKKAVIAFDTCHGNTITGASKLDSNHEGETQGDVAIAKTATVIKYIPETSLTGKPDGIAH
jgi:hypothetical protein